MAELQRAREVRVPRAQARHRVRRLGHRLDAHDALPIHGVAVRDLQRDGRAGRPPLPDPAGDPHRVALDRLAGSTPVSELPAPKVDVDLRGREGETRRHAVHERDEAGTVRFARGEEAH